MEIKIENIKNLTIDNKAEEVNLNIYSDGEDVYININEKKSNDNIASLYFDFNTAEQLKNAIKIFIKERQREGVFSFQDKIEHIKEEFRQELSNLKQR